MQKQFSDVALVLNPTDNVAIAKHELEAGTRLTMPDQTSLALRDLIPAGHKFAIQSINENDSVVRYGYAIGIATQSIQPGDWVHTHNLSVGNTERAYTYRAVEPVKAQTAQQTFLGYRRTDGHVGTRNYIAVISTANCSAHVTTEIARAFTLERLTQFPNIDGVIPLVHNTGCGYNANDLVHTYLHRTLTNIAHNPNIGGYLFVSLGCEVNEIGNYCDSSSINPRIEMLKPYPVHGTSMVIQDQGGFRKTVASGVAAIEAMLPQVNAIVRTPQPISELSLALQCGGSDGWSGVTANPLLGLVVDKIVMQGGTAVLSETPEIFGAEHLLTQRVASAEVAQKLIRRFNWWNEQARLLKFSVDTNPSPGNQHGGL